MPAEITGSDLKKMLESREEIVILDVRDTPEYLKERLPGAEHMLISEMDKEGLERFDKDVLIVTYSEDNDCPASRIAAERLEESGVRALNYQGSFKDWKESDYPTEEG